MEILFEDDRVVVCVKPAGVLSTDEPGGMPDLLRKALGDEDTTIKSVHRLDRSVGGVMVYARTRRAASDLSGQIRDGRFRKEYRAVVYGAPPEPAGTMGDWLLRDTGKRRTYVVPEGTPGAREALLDYRVLAEAGELSLLTIALHTGRTHQIRCQMSGRGLPLLGDRKYGRPHDGCGVALWSHSLRFYHPRAGEEMLFRKDPPDEYPWNLFK